MHLYSLHGYEGGYTLCHNEKYSDEEFKNMCKEAPLGGEKGSYQYYSERKIKNHLIEKYGFKEAVYTAGFFIDGDIE